MRRCYGRSTLSHMHELTRPALLRALSALPLTAQPPTAWSDDEQQVLPLSLCGGAYCVSFSIDKQSFRAIVDTGSPFLLVDGTPGPSPWGTYRGSGGNTGLEDTDEKFGGQDVGVQWRKGDVVLGDGELAVQNATFGVVRAYVGKGGDGAVFLGLAKRRLPRIRPTLLEQTTITALRFAFLRRTLTLSRRSLIPRGTDAVPLLDLRGRGAPISSCACRIQRLCAPHKRGLEPKAA